MTGLFFRLPPDRPLPPTTTEGNSITPLTNYRTNILRQEVHWPILRNYRTNVSYRIVSARCRYLILEETDNYLYTSQYTCIALKFQPRNHRVWQLMCCFLIGIKIFQIIQLISSHIECYRKFCQLQHNLSSLHLQEYPWLALLYFRSVTCGGYREDAGRVVFLWGAVARQPPPVPWLDVWGVVVPVDRHRQCVCYKHTPKGLLFGLL